MMKRSLMVGGILQRIIVYRHFGWIEYSKLALGNGMQFSVPGWNKVLCSWIDMGL